MKILFLIDTTYFQQSLFSQEIEGCLEQMDRIRVFFNKLDEKYKKNITFRARMNSKDSMHFDEDKFILSLSPHIKFDDGSQHINRVIKNYDLIIVGYDSTAIYELLSLKKKPFLIIFPENYLDNYLDKAKKNFLLLKKKKILFLTPQAAANAINKKKNILIKEWDKKINSSELKKFSLNYAKRSFFKFYRLKKLFDKNLPLNL